MDRLRLEGRQLAADAQRPVRSASRTIKPLQRIGLRSFLESDLAGSPWETFRRFASWEGFCRVWPLNHSDSVTPFAANASTERRENPTKPLCEAVATPFSRPHRPSSPTRRTDTCSQRAVSRGDRITSAATGQGDASPRRIARAAKARSRPMVSSPITRDVIACSMYAFNPVFPRTGRRPHPCDCRAGHAHRIAKSDVKKRCLLPSSFRTLSKRGTTAPQ